MLWQQENAEEAQEGIKQCRLLKAPGRWIIAALYWRLYKHLTKREKGLKGENNSKDGNLIWNENILKAGTV